MTQGLVDFPTPAHPRSSLQRKPIMVSPRRSSNLTCRGIVASCFWWVMVVRTTQYSAEVVRVVFSKEKLMPMGYLGDLRFVVELGESERPKGRSIVRSNPNN